MATTLQRTHVRTPLNIEMLVGIWLVISPFLLNNINNEALWSFLITGAVILIAALTSRNDDRPSVWPARITLLAGIWLLIAPMIVPYTSTATWNGLISGIIVVGMSLWAMVGTRRVERDEYGTTR